MALAWGPSLEEVGINHRGRGRVGVVAVQVSSCRADGSLLSSSNKGVLGSR